ncbi:PucR family transcriptional regulator [Modestobacter lapidis]|nr:PucR family transcriptional regulator [Modestobacter lapidis]
MQDQLAPEHLSVQEVLGLPPLRGASVVAGATGLTARVVRMNMMEVPDVLPWVRAGELLVTSGYPMQSFDDDQLIALIEGLKRKGVAALVAKIGGRYVGGFSSAVIRRADELNFPVVAMPLDLAFTDLQETYFSEVIDRHRRALAGQARVREFGEYLRQLMNERSSASEQELATVFDVLAVPVGTSVHVCVLRVGRPLTLSSYQRLCERITRSMGPTAQRVLLFPYADHIVLVVPQGCVQEVLASLREALDVLAPSEPAVRCGVGNRADSLVEWRRSFGQANRALQVTEGDPRAGIERILWFSETGTHQLVDALVSQGLAPAFVQNALGALHQDDEMLSTLHVLLTNNCSIVRTAGDMTFHYNTIRNRLARLESLVGPFVDSGHRRAELLLACETRSRLTGEGAVSLNGTGGD